MPAQSASLLISALRGDRHRLEFELGLVRVGHLLEALQTHVIAAALEHGEVELDIEVLGQKRQVLVGQLILQCLRSRSYYNPLAARDGRNEICQRLTGAGACLDDEMLTVGDGVGHQAGHLDLTRPILGVVEGRRGSGQRNGRGSTHLIVGWIALVAAH